ncbi:MAG: hypothetical protein ACJ0FQ_05415 [Gammaproteobacteria bacterium]
MNKSTRKLRFDRVSKNRLARALEAIDSLENLSNKSNYEWDQKEIDDISGKLMAKVKLVMASFGSSTPMDRFEKLQEQDRLQHKLLRDTDPEVARLVDDWLRKNGRMSSSPPESDSDIVRKFKDLYLELLEHRSKDSSKAQNFSQRLYKLNPRFNISRLSAKHNIDRLVWLGSEGKTHSEILSSNSMYRVHPDPAKQNPLLNLKWDIEQGRVLQIPKNSLEN